MCPGSRNGINYLNYLLTGGEQGGEVLGVVAPACSPKATGRWVLWAYGPMELRRVTACHCEERSLLPRVTSVFQWQLVSPK